MAWYRKYRPQKVADLQIVPVREQLLKILDSGKTSHAYLFAGPKGTGKTSTARILARVLNDPINEKVAIGGKGKLVEPDPENQLLQKIAQGQSEVVVELDAASNRGIDDVRRLQEVISMVPTEGLIRVVILDEVHMLTNDAFNALLKVLEEPPARVVFILATTELHKVPATVQSRCELIAFRQATAEEIGQALKVVIAGEKLKVDPEQISSLAAAARGSFRDAVKYLEQTVRGGQIDSELLEQIAFGQQRIESLLISLAKRDAVATSEFFQQVRQKGENFASLEQTIISALQDRLHRAIVRAEKPQTQRTLVQLLDHLSQRLGGPEPVDGIKLEVACLLWCLEQVRPAGAAREVPVITTTLEEAKQQAKEQANLETQAANLNLNFDLVQQAWPKILLSARAKSQALEAILKQAKLRSVTSASVELEFGHTFHQDQLNTPKYRLAFLSVLAETLGEGVSFSSQVIAEPMSLPADKEATEDSLLKAVEEAVLSLG